MTAQTEDRATARRDGKLYNVPVATNVKIYAGSIVMKNATGYATKGATATGQIALGRAEAQVDNTGGADGAKRIDVRPGVYQFANSSAGDLITIANVGATCYIVDDQTVALTNGGNTRSAAGVIIDVDTDGVWVKIGL